MEQETTFVYYKKDTGEILRISPVIDESITDEYAEVHIEDVKPILTGAESPLKWRVEHNLISNKLEVRRNTDYVLNKLKVSDMLYEIPIKYTSPPDIMLIQDFTRTCWKVLIGDKLESKLLDSKVSLKHNLSFSVTEPNNPNVLYKNFLVDLEQLIKNHYQIIPFTDSFEHDKKEVSVYTKKEFNSYFYKRVDE